MNWRTTKGVITHCYFEDNKIDRYGGVSSFNTNHKLVVEYTYTVRGQEHTSTRYAFGVWSLQFKFLAKKLHALFYQGEEVTVYYDPDKHYESVLITGIKLFHLVQMGIGVLWVIGFYFEVVA